MRSKVEKKENIEKTNGRKRGAPPGNANAVTHGFYRKTTLEASRKDLEVFSQTVPEEVLDATDLSREISTLRGMIWKAQMMADQTQSMQGMMLAIQTIGMASSKLATMVKVQQELEADSEDEHSPWAMLQVALQHIQEEKDQKLEQRRILETKRGVDGEGI